MKYINPSAEYWQQGDDLAAHVARCARVCYASDRTTGNEAMVKRLEQSGHASMFRHESRYYIINNIQKRQQTWVIHFLQNSDYCAVYVLKKKTAYISTNGQFVRDHADFFAQYLANNEVSEGEFTAQAVATNVKAIMMLLRHTVCVVTQIGTSREYNRTSPNNIAEQSTRYVNFGKRGGITICRPWYMEMKKFYQPWPEDDLTHKELPMPKHRKICIALMKIGWHIDDWIYRLLLRFGMVPQDARGKLPLDAATKVVYTYNGYEWRHIFDLRLRQTTGKAHPNAIRLAGLIYNQLRNALIVKGMKGLEL